jgi:hypothetical protein
MKNIFGTPKNDDNKTKIVDDGKLHLNYHFLQKKCEIKKQIYIK